MKTIPRITLGVLIASLGSFANAADFWISPSGSGSMDGSSEANALPKSSLGTTLNTTMNAGDTLYVLSGDYGSTTIGLSSDGAAGSPKRIVGVDSGGGYPHFSGGSWSRTNPDSGQWQILGVNGNYWEIENLELSSVQYAIKNSTSQSGSNIHFKNIDIHDVRHGVYLSYVDDTTFENVTITEYTKHGFRLDRGCDNVTFTNCMADMTAGDTSWWDYSEAFPFGFISNNGGTGNTNIAFIDCLAANNRRNAQGISYWNGDGFVVEGNTSGVSFDGCRSINNEDGGFDVKPTATLTNCVSVKNYRAFRMWSSSTLTNCVATYPFRRANSVPNGVESSAGSGVWTKDGSPTADYFTFHANNGRGAHEEGSGGITLTNSIVSFSGSSGSFTAGNITLGSGTVTYRPGSGTDPDFVNSSINWDGIGDDMNSQTYGDSKGYFDGPSGLVFSSSGLSDYHSQTGSGSVTLEGGDTTLHLTGNVWRKYAYSYEVTESTVLRVTVDASDVGEAIAVGFDTNNNLSDATTNIKIGGPQEVGSSFYVYSESVTTSSGPVTFDIPIGSYFTGSMNYLTFIADDDDDSSADVTFSEIEIYEHVAATSLVMDAGGLSDYSPPQSASGSTVTLEDSNTALHLEGNVWRKYSYAYDVTANTMLEVTVDAPDVGEIIAIGLDSNNAYDDTATNLQLGGPQTSSSYITQVSPSYTAGSGEVTYLIPVGSYFTGSMNYVTFIADDDADASTDVTFSDILVFESPVFVSGNFSDYSSQTGSGSFSLQSNDTAINLTGNIWRKHPISYDVTQNTVLEVTVDASNTGEIIGVGFDTDNDYQTGSTNVQLGGSQETPSTFYAAEPAYTAGEGAVTYVIPIGLYVSGSQNYITFIADDDASSNIDVTFSNVRIYESQ